MRTHSLGVDQNDDHAITHEDGWEVKKHRATMLPTVPFFFNKDKWSVPLVDSYMGSSAFLIASGPSFANVDKNLLASPGVWTMTLNNAVRSFRGNASCIVDDPSRFVASLWLDPKIMKFVPTSHFKKPIWDNRTFKNPDGTLDTRWQPMGTTVGECPNVIGYQRNEKFHAARFLKEDTINWGNHKKWGGGRSVMLASLRILYLLGFRQVYLVGVDFEMTDQKRYHFDEGRTEAAVKGNMSTYAKMVGWFTELKPIFDNEGFIVKNCNPQSGLRVFPFISVEDAVKESSARLLGETSIERTRGMYSKYEEKLMTFQQFQQQPNITQEQKDKLIDDRENQSRLDDMND
jgi:hypothetical protein